jgi:hypothetical protein
MVVAWQTDNQFLIGAPGIGGNWTLHHGDRYFPADVNRDGRKEIIVSSSNIGILREEHGAIIASWIGWDGPTLHADVSAVEIDVDGDGKNDLFYAM